MKRTLTIGSVIVVTQHEYPNLIGERTVLKWQSNRVCLSRPGHEATVANGSWWTMPKREHIAFNDGTVTVLRDPEWGDAGTFMTFHIKP